MTKRNVGDLIWRGYARPSVFHGHYPEIRPGRIRHIRDDGTCDLAMEGIIPGREGKRTPGCWISFGVDPDLILSTPEEALAQAVQAVEQCKADKSSAPSTNGAVK